MQALQALCTIATHDPISVLLAATATGMYCYGKATNNEMLQLAAFLPGAGVPPYLRERYKERKIESVTDEIVKTTICLVAGAIIGRLLS